MSALLAPTLRETPAEAEIPSHRLMLRAGLMRKAAGGIYTYLPLGHRTLKKIMAIVREEMDRAGAQELMLPILQPAELWHESGRWKEYGDEMFRMKDRHGRLFCLGPTHEEIITDTVRTNVRSYRQLPINLYQIQNKYRDEIRPRFGVMRGREFIMKDAYSFDRDQAGLDQSYETMFRSYMRIFARCGLSTRPVLADPGAIGGNETHEFIVFADSGEAAIVHCNACEYAANIEQAECKAPADLRDTAPDVPAIREMHTPDVRTIDELEQFLGKSARDMIKTLIYLADGEVVVALVRGDRELNEIKLARAVGAGTVEAAPPDVVEQVTGAPVGFAGPVGLRGAKIIADFEIPAIQDGITGANKADAHFVHVRYGRDYTVDELADLRTAAAGDPCPDCGEPLAATRGIEVGQVFKLGEKYSRSMGATFLDESGEERHFVMGCYGIGVSRTMAAIIEQHHDEDGIIWPVSVAPYHAVIVVIRPEDEAQAKVANELYAALWDKGIETVLDDREERPGVKFKDADLIGFPVRLVVGPRTLETGAVEVKLRRTREESVVPCFDAATFVLERVRAGE